MKRTLLYWTLAFWIGGSINLIAGYSIRTVQWWVINIPVILLLAALILTDKNYKK